MATDFSRTLSHLRKERGISQRKAAGELGVSQALLSHYENGIREPGLAFVVRACDYYGVSADYILARTLARDGSMLTAEELMKASAPDKSLQGSVLAALRGKLLAGAVEVLFGLLGELDDRGAINAAADGLGAQLYQLYRRLYNASGADPDYFSLGEEEWQSGAASVLARLCELEYVRRLNRLAQVEADFPDLSHDALAEAYPGRSQALTQVLSTADSRLSRLGGDGE
ncbi:MAG: helix-turn-helix transcriptional regulator [Oscillibacter sp.]|nr:helix-turn-helix transcriptional regulator [Oscillibacter sp.]